MKEAIVSLLQQRMDKCTTEQFWAVAILTGSDVFIITQAQNLAVKICYGILLVGISVATVWGVGFIIERHCGWYRSRVALASLLQNEPDVPRGLKTSPNFWDWKSLVFGVGFYVVWVLAGCVLCYLTAP
jgi:hypothetical protein